MSHVKQFDYRNGLDLPELAEKIVTFFAETDEAEPEVSVLLPNGQDTKLFLEKLANKEAILEVLEGVFAQEPDEMPAPAEHAAEDVVAETEGEAPAGVTESGGEVKVEVESEAEDAEVDADSDDDEKAE